MARNKKVEILSHDGQVLHPITDGDCVIFSDGETLTHKLSEDEAVMYTPEVVNSSPMFKVGEGDTSDYSSSVLDGAYQEAILKGQTYVNTIQEPSADEITLPTPFTEYERTQSKTFTEMNNGTFGINLVGQSYVNSIQEPSKENYVALGEALEFQNKKVEYTSDGQIKSAMLKGQTLVNIIEKKNCDKAYAVADTNIQIKPSTKYIAFFDLLNPNANLRAAFIVTSSKKSDLIIGSNKADDLYTYNVQNGVGTEHQVSYDSKFLMFTSGANETWLHIRTGSSYFQFTYDNLMIIEYQEGMENWDIPYFQGMQSVTMSTELENVCSRYNSSVAKNGKTFTVGTSVNRSLYLSYKETISNYNFKQNTKYLMQFKITNLNLDGADYITLLFSDGTVASGNALFGDYANTGIKVAKNGVYRTVLTTSNIVSTSHFIIKGYSTEWESSTSTSRALTISQIMCIEYQNGMENWDLPYFETTQLMKPVKTYSTNKNTFNKNMFTVAKGSLYGYWKFKNDETKSYTLSITDKDTSVDITDVYFGVTARGIDSKNDNGASDYKWLVEPRPENRLTNLTTTKNFISFFPNNQATLDKICSRYNIQLEEASSITTYTPHQSKTTSALEPITLRAIGNVKDTLDLSTGEYVQRIGEITVDGVNAKAKKWVINNEWSETSRRFDLDITGVKRMAGWNGATTIIKSDKTNVFDDIGRANPQCNSLYKWDDVIVLYINDSTITTIDQANNWLEQNPIKIQYQLANPITRKISLEYPNLQTYQDITHVQSIAMDGTLIPNIYLPSDISYKVMLKPNTSYNVIVDREVIDSTNQLTVNLGGTTANITANRTVVRTPSTLSNETLTFSGKDNRIAKAMLIEGSTLINGDLPHFDGIGDVKLGRVVENLCMSNETLVGNATVSSTLYMDRIQLKVTKAGSCVETFELTKQLQNGKKYFVYCPWDCSDNAHIFTGAFKMTHDGITTFGKQNTVIDNKKYTIFTINEKEQINPYTSFTIGRHGTVPVNTTMTIRRPILCEYIDGMENWDWESIGYFTGTRNIGNEFMRIGNKNLFDGQIIQGAWNSDTDFVNSKNYVCTKNRILVKPNTTYTTSLNGIRIALTKLYIDEYFNLIKMEGNGTSTFTTPTNCKYLKLDYYKSEGIIPTDLQNLQLEEASSATSYVAHKHNSLHILPNEQIPLTFVQGTIAYAHNGTWENAINNTNTTRIRTQLLDLEPNETYRVSCGHSNHGFGCQGYDNSLLAKSDSGWTYGEYYFTTTKDVHKYAINVRYKDNSNISPSVLHQVRLEKVTDITLRSVGDVKDELDLTRGVYIQRMYEVKLNGFEDWSIHNAYSTDNHLCFYWGYKKIPSYDYNKFGQWGCVINVTPLLIPRGWNSFYGAKADEEGVTFNGDNKQNITIKIRKDRLSSQDVNGFKQWLQSNPITVQYPLETPIEHKINIPMKNEANQTIAKPNGLFTLPLMYSETNHVDINSQIYPKVQSRDYISYPVIANNSQLHTVFHNKLGTGNLTVNLCGTNVTSVDGTSKCTVTTPSTISQYELRLSGAGNKVSNVCVFSGDYMNVNVPYVQGMMNAANPIVKNIGKNLIINEFMQGYYEGGNGVYVSNHSKFVTTANLIPVNPNMTYIQSSSLNVNNGAITFFDKNKKYIKQITNVLKSSFITPSNCYYLSISWWENGGLNPQSIEWAMLEQSSTSSRYEPYKENNCKPENGIIKLTQDDFEQGTFNTTVTNVDYESRKENQTTRIRTKGLIPIKPNMTYSISVNKGYAIFIGGYDKNQKCLGSASSYTWANGRTFTATSNCHYICIAIRTDNNKNITPSDFNNVGIIVQKLEDIITLRSLPNGVRDELNLETGEYIQRIGEVVLDGNINPSLIFNINKRGTAIENRTTLYTKITIGEETTHGEWVTNTTPKKFITDRLVNDTTNAYYALIPNTVAKSGGSIHISIDTDLLESETKDGVIKYLSKNPVTYIGELKTPIIKQIDIHNYPHSYQNGHVIIESGDPTTPVPAQLTYKCVTNRSGQIQEHTEQVEKQERQINELETLILENIRQQQNRSQNFLTSLISTLEIEEE